MYEKKSATSLFKRKREMYRQQVLDLLEVAVHRAKDHLLEKERVLMAVMEKNESKVKELLTVEEKATYFELKSRLYRADLLHDITDSEYSLLYQKASDLLMAAIDRNLTQKGYS